MPRRNHLIFSLLIVGVLLCLALPGTAQKGEYIFKVSNIIQLSLQDLTGELRKARVVVIGEQHDNWRHHEAQLSVIRALHEAGQKIAVGFEMFQKDAQGDLDRWVSGRMSEEEFFRVYSDNWDFNLWPLYRGIFDYAREHRIPMLGLNVPRSIVSRVAREGFSSLTEKERKKIGFLSCNVDPRYREILARVLGGGGHLGNSMFNNFCEAQVVWDTSMALNIIDYAEKNGDTLVIALAGNFHAWKRGIAEQISQRSELKSLVILPSEDTSLFNYSVVLEDADYVWWLQ